MEERLSIEFVTFKRKTYSYLINDEKKVKETKKAKGTRECVIKRKTKFNDYNDCLLNNKIILKSQQRLKSEKYNEYAERKSIRSHYVVMMIKDFKLLIKLQYIHMEQMFLKYVEVR